MTQSLITILDLNEVAFLKLHNIEPRLELQGTRVIFVFEATDAFFDISALYKQNPHVPVLDFVRELKTMRGRMLALRDDNGGARR